jgi:hypothetical protein
MFFAHGQIAAWQHAQVEMQSNDWHAAVWMLITINTGERVFGVRVRQELLGSDTRAQSEEGSSKDVEAGLVGGSAAAGEMSGEGSGTSSQAVWEVARDRNEGPEAKGRQNLDTSGQGGDSEDAEMADEGKSRSDKTEWGRKQDAEVSGAKGKEEKSHGRPSDEGKGKEECKKDDEEQEDEDSERKDRDRHRHSELIKLGAAGISLPPPLTVSLFASVLYS